MNINCIIIDDDPISVKIIEKHIQQTTKLALTKVLSNGDEALTYFKNPDEKIDLVFLDVEMPKLDGLTLIKSLEVKPPFIITTAQKKYSYDAFELNAVDFLSKPISFKRFSKAAERFYGFQDQISTNELTEQTSVFVKSKRVWKKIDLADILYIKANNTFISIYTSTDRYHINTSMKGFLDQIRSSDFIRVHRSYIVNTKNIKEIEHDLISIGEKTIPISKSHMPEVLASLTFIK